MTSSDSENVGEYNGGCKHGGRGGEGQCCCCQE